MHVRLNMAPDTGDNQGSAGSGAPDTDPAAGNPAGAGSGLDLTDPSLKDSPKLAKFKSRDALAKSYLELESKRDRSVEMPGKDAKPEDWEQFYSRVGRPKTADDYALEAVEGFQADNEFMKRIKGAFHASGLTDAQAKKVFSHIATESTASRRALTEAQVKAAQDGEKAMRDTWKDKYDEKVELARRFATKAGGEEAFKHLEQGGYTRDPVLMGLLSAAGEATGAHRFVGGSLPTTKPGPYPYMNEGR